jgi:hypothetical protein
MDSIITQDAMMGSFHSVTKSKQINKCNQVWFLKAKEKSFQFKYFTEAWNRVLLLF